VHTVELHYDKAGEANRYVATVQARHEVDHAFRVAGKVAERKVEVGQTVREGDVLAVLDASDYRLAEEATRQQLAAATAQAHQAESDRQRLNALKTDGSVSASDDEQAQSRASPRRRPPKPRRGSSSLLATA
jgi:multidrug efflux pump subunit AcrA (membrane-fusion protein)